MDIVKWLFAKRHIEKILCTKKHIINEKSFEVDWCFHEVIIDGNNWCLYVEIWDIQFVTNMTYGIHRHTHELKALLDPILSHRIKSYFGNINLTINYVNNLHKWGSRRTKERC